MSIGRGSDTVPLTFQQIQDARTLSTDGGTSLRLCKLQITDIKPPQASELAASPSASSGTQEPTVERLALHKNRLSALPQEFALLTCLRYLNLRHNHFSIFPNVLTLMPSLDTLDISYNRITRLPSHPGHLIRLRVFCFIQNKITHLPSYLPEFQRLNLLQIDHNPLDWPPASVVESIGSVHDISNSKDFIHKLQNWIVADLARSKQYDDSGYGEHHEWEHVAGQPDDPWQFPLTRSRAGPERLHSRSFSIDSNSSSIIEPSVQPNSVIPDIVDDSQRRRHNGDAEEYKGYGSHPQRSNTLEVEQIHHRTSSHASNSSRSQTAMIGKKSLPDLRTAQKDSVRKLQKPSEDRSAIPLNQETKGLSEFSVLPPLPLRKSSSSSFSTLHYPLTPSVDDAQPSNVSPSVSIERNSYFRRSSAMLINNSLPRSLQCLLDSARNILFAMSQLYQTLEHYAQHGIDERLSTTFKKLLDPANAATSHLIRSLDRVHDVSQKSTPSPVICRGLVECCRDTVAVFRKGVNLLTLQMGLDCCADTRFVRWLILELYAITTELAFAWKALLPYLESLKPFLHTTFYAQQTTFSYSSTSELSPSPYQTTGVDQSLAPSVRLRPVGDDLMISLGGKVRTTRRHAGSFSSKDVAIGRELPSYDAVPSRLGGLATHTPTLRNPKRQATAPPFTTSTPLAPSLVPQPSPSLHRIDFLHVRHGSQSSMAETNPISLLMSLDSPSASKSQADGDVHRAIMDVVKIAPIVWDQIEEALSNALDTKRAIKENLDHARAVTKILSDLIRGGGESRVDGNYERRILRENAHLFLKVLVQLSNTLKVYGGSHPVPMELRSNMVQLTNLTEVFAILLHFSSIPSSPHRSRSPPFLMSAPSSSTSHPIEDNQLASSLTRSRSAQPSVPLKHTLASHHDTPGSLPGVVPTTPVLRRIRPARDRDTRVESPEPG